MLSKLRSHTLAILSGGVNNDAKQQGNGIKRLGLR